MKTATDERDVLDRFAAEFASRRAKSLRRGERVTKQHAPRASSISDCQREIAYQITDGTLKSIPDDYLLARFERGRDVERWLIRDLIDDGWVVTEQQRSFTVTEKDDADEDIDILTGHIEGRITFPWNMGAVIFECKSLNPNVYARVDRIEDFSRMGSFWARYPKQLLGYMYAYSEPMAMFILDDCLGHRKVIPVYLDEHLDECEKILRDCKAAAIAARDGTGEDLPYSDDPTACAGCWARRLGLCFPPAMNDAASAIDDAAPLSLMLAEHGALADELGEDAKRLAKLDKDIKADLKARGKGTYVAAGFVASVKVGETTQYDVPDKIKDRYKITAPMTRSKWERIE